MYHKYGILILKIYNMGEILILKAYLFIINLNLNRHPVFSVNLHFELDFCLQEKAWSRMRSDVLDDPRTTAHSPS